MNIVGHEDIVAALSKGLPAVCLFIGPHSVGKWATAEEFRREIAPWKSDLLRIHELKAETAEALVRFAVSAPAGHKKVAIVQLDGARTDVLNTLLKTLEESPHVQFFLISAQPVLPTIASRAAVYRFGRLSKAEVTRVLVERANKRDGDATKLAAAAGGQVAEATRQGDLSSPKAVVMIAVRALRDRDLPKLESVAREWDEVCTRLLIEWCYESLTRPRLFSTEELDLSKIGKRVPVQILGALRIDIRPGMLVRAALSPLLRGA